MTDEMMNLRFLVEKSAETDFLRLPSHCCQSSQENLREDARPPQRDNGVA
ncbi:MAG: hypothetical protein SV862_13240 [Pseudomonadota bacterium]|nr:hypothetical protein [Pseudomonadota bacterium]